MSAHEELSNKVANLFNFATEKEEIEHEASMLSLRVLRSLKIHMEQNDISKAELANKVGTSKSYITQLFTGDKLVNMKLLYRIEKAFGISFNVHVSTRREKMQELVNCLLEDHYKH